MGTHKLKNPTEPLDRIRYDTKEFKNSIFSYDYVEISHGAMSDKFCGSTIPAPITITNGNVSIVFRSDEYVNSAGFELNYMCMPETTPAPTTTPPTTPTYICGGVLTENSGTITSRNYPEIYPNNEDCTWTKQCSGDIVLTFVAFRLEYHSSCR